MAERDHRAQKGVVFIFSKDNSNSKNSKSFKSEIRNKGNSKVIDIVRYKDNFLIHKQIEIKNGRLFMRLKKRSIPVHA